MHWCSRYTAHCILQNNYSGPKSKGGQNLQEFTVHALGASVAQRTGFFKIIIVAQSPRVVQIYKNLWYMQLSDPAALRTPFCKKIIVAQFTGWWSKFTRIYGTCNWVLPLHCAALSGCSVNMEYCSIHQVQLPLIKVAHKCTSHYKL